jgi:ABC-type protease/lipase transport system fused ATPase/permease subunit
VEQRRTVVVVWRAHHDSIRAVGAVRKQLGAEAVIEARGLGYTYPGAQAPAVRGLTFRVEKGEVFGFLGPSGAGKSTTQKILIALQRDYEGTVTILGRDLRQWRSDRNRTPAPLCS